MPVVNPGIRRLLASAIQRLFNGASFSAPLTHSAIPTRAASGTTATFTRATTATVRDNEGVLRTAIAGEARFEGARRVRNLVAASESVAGWTNASGFTVSATQFTATATAGFLQMPLISGLNTKGVFVWSMKLACSAGDGTLAVTSIDAADGSDGTTTVLALTSTPTRYSGIADFSASSTFSGNLTLQVGNQGAATNTVKTISITEIQIEDITGRADQTTPSEYVSVGVESAPYYHGSMVDGVKCFATDINGAAIPSTTLLGYVAEGARTNLCLQSNSFTTTWAATGTPTPTQNAIGPDGAVSAWTLTDNSAVVTEDIAQSILLTAATYTSSVFVGKTSGAQSSYPVIYSYSGASNLIAICTIDTTNGVATAWTSYTGVTIASGFTARCVNFNANFWRVEMTYTATATGWQHNLIPAGALTATKSSGMQDVAAQGSAVFYGVQVELGSFASSYIATTTAAVTRNADVLTYPSSGNIDGTKGWCYAEAAFTNAAYLTGLAANIVGTSTSGRFIEANSSTSLRCIDSAVNVAAKTLSTPLSSAKSKLASTWSVSGGMLVTASGESPATQATFVNMDTAGNIGIMCRNDGTTQPYGNIKNVRIGQRALSSSELQAITS